MASRPCRAASVPATLPPPSPTDLSRYVGQHPQDRVDGVSFLGHPLVAAAVASAVPDATIRAFVLNPRQTTTPISRNDNLIVASGCEPHNCADHNWTMAITPDASQMNLCVFNGDVDARNGQIFSLSAKASSRPGSCWQ